MSSFLLKSCCCWIDLRTGCLISAYSNLVFLAVIFYLFLDGFINAVTCNDCGLAGRITTSITFGIDVLVAILSFVLTILILISIHKHTYKFMHFFLKHNTFTLIINSIQLVVLSQLSLSLNTVEIIATVAFFVLTAYILLVVRSYYIKTKHAAKDCQPTTANLEANTSDPENIIVTESHSEANKATEPNTNTITHSV